MSKITDEQYNELDSKLSDLYSRLQDQIEIAQDDDNTAYPNLEMRTFEQGKVAAMRQFLPFAGSDDIFFNAVKAEAEEINKILLEIESEQKDGEEEED